MSPRLRTFVTRTAMLAATYLIVLVLIQAGVINAYLQATMVTICVNIMLAVSLNLVTGFTGQFSLGHAGFMAIGAYSTGLITMAIPTVWGFVLGLATGAVLAAMVGFLIGLPTLRLRGDYLAIATLGMAEIIRVLLLNMGFTNGAAGLSGIPQFVNWSWLFVLTVGTVVLITNFLNSRHGRDCIAVREDEIAAESIGVRSTRVKTLAFMTGAFFGAVAGGVYASYFYFLKPDLFGFMQSINILVIVVLGGLGSVSGSIIAAVLLAIVSTLLQPFPEIRMILYSLVLVVLMVFRPQGIMGSRELSLKVFSRLLPKRSKDAAATEGATA
ncbi:MAG: branched-chain amino acid ABC transporter permease [Propionibacteriaceae bacterium]|uniref:Branched-chain amino acid ABC transporter permease n=1 Tax=Brooklawnia propionicigenes TaxID=3041175 RepID=A0AAN0MED3_9ACTN|nr:branched-chain amino acid ABC transporter permease [Brooklawnia sp. SH051]MCB0884695.1 branched-chain amino acid ABC transporter permease [Propionibacteriaceae bacterium]MEA5120806.1 branched-chain amino acid ABC transporter permease [Propionibacterium sp.]BEH00774.1 branched-chain amino acid ABC transporter permease [Brooklawnia sp. SH051]